MTTTAARTLNIETVAESPMMLYSDWIDFSAEDGDIAGVLIHNAGLGGATLCLRMTIDGKKVSETIDVASLLQQWADAVVDEVRS